MPQVGFKQVLRLPLLTFYGVGTILGAGIYVLVGKVAGLAGMFTPVAFMLASLVAGFTAFSYAELSARFPQNAAEAIYIAEGLRHKGLALTVGMLIVLASIVSTATLLNGAAGYLRQFIALPAWQLISLMTVLIAIVVAWGIGKSVGTAALMTVVEIFGLVLIIWLARDNLWLLPQRLPELLPPLQPHIWGGILAGALLAFYAFLGFEDIVNVAEEVQHAQRTVPVAIILSLVITGVFYLLVSLACILVIAPTELAHSEAPLALMYQTLTGRNPVVITLISVVSVLNGALIQVIKASRLLHGINAMQWRNLRLASIHARTRTPINSILLICSVILVLALVLPTVSLALLTSYITLGVFTLVNVALWRLKLRVPEHSGMQVPLWVPIAGFVSTLLFVVLQVL
jgi:basic amino acid/polyamine antiporter, APA family